MLGTLDDWLTLRKKIEGLKDYDLVQWVNALLPIIDQFINTYQGQVDLKFWDMCVKAYPQPSSCNFIDQNYGAHNGLTGWVLNFFPYTSTGSAIFSDLKEMSMVHDSKQNKC